MTINSFEPIVAPRQTMPLPLPANCPLPTPLAQDSVAELYRRWCVLLNCHMRGVTLAGDLRAPTRHSSSGIFRLSIEGSSDSEKFKLDHTENVFHLESSAAVPAAPRRLWRGAMRLRPGWAAAPVLPRRSRPRRHPCIRPIKKAHTAKLDISA